MLRNFVETSKRYKLFVFWKVGASARSPELPTTHQKSSSRGTGDFAACV
jgi:hypothetical protein